MRDRATSRFVGLLLLAGCPPNAQQEPAPTFTEVRETLVLSCGLDSCHGSGEGDLTIDEDTAYDNLVDVPSAELPEETLVIPGNPDDSYLVMKIEGAPGISGEPMPPPAGGLDPADIQMIRDWIAAGAENN